MHRRMALVGLLAVTSCAGEGESGIQSKTSALVAKSHRLLHDDPAGGCDTRDFADVDWYPGACKTECAAPATAISSSFPGQNGLCGTIVTETPPPDPGPGPGPDPDSQFNFHFEEFSHILGCGDNVTPRVLTGTGYVLHFTTANDRRSPTVTVPGWASDPSLITGECDNLSAVVGVASDDYWHPAGCVVKGGNWARHGYGIVGARCSTVANPDGAVLIGVSNCKVLDFTSTSVNEAGGGTTFVGNDWDFGYFKGECGPGRYIKGIAHSGLSGGASSRATKILCCSPQYQNIPG